ncbi:DUF3289 family protein [Enterobacter sp.]|uniref:DUF3289 family protein n=1 Tax=Enterobacter sp. TaxID=42895 RepID=UPI00296E9C81|nr:DUF3289 family protein [Enterobacter sp.]
MSIDLALSMQLPYKIFSTFHRFDNYYVDDMKYGDLDNFDFNRLGLDDISAYVDPYKLIAFHPFDAFNRHDLDFNNKIVQGKPITRQQCANILFEEMKDLSSSFAYGKYAHIISELIHHFHYGNGSSWHSLALDNAFREVVEGTESGNTLMIIRKEIDTHLIKRQKARLDFNFLAEIRNKISRQARLPKFNRLEDRFNGLGISVHDVYAQEITLFNFQRYAMSWHGLLRFRAQDHFGLGIEDIINPLYKKFRFFRIWFFLQRHRDYAYKPFFTNFSAHTNIRGSL